MKRIALPIFLLALLATSCVQDRYRVYVQNPLLQQDPSMRVFYDGEMLDTIEVAYLGEVRVDNTFTLRVTDATIDTTVFEGGNFAITALVDPEFGLEELALRVVTQAATDSTPALLDIYPAELRTGDLLVEGSGEEEEKLIFRISRAE